MYLNQFSLRVVGGKEVAGGYVELNHNQQYSVQLRNDRDVRCDAYLEIDGKHIGTFRIDAHGSLTLERPVHDNGRFTFYKLGTQEARDAGLQEHDPNLGLIKVTFTPEYKRIARPLTNKPYENNWLWGYGVPWYPDTRHEYTAHGGGHISYRASLDYNTPIGGGGSYSSCAVPTADAGGTGLSGYSNQNFYTVEGLMHDLTQQTVIHLRLVCRRENVTRPLSTHSTPVPPPLQ